MPENVFMKRSSNRILTTHVGSLPRPRALVEAIVAREKGEPLDERAAAATLKNLVADVVRLQAETGIDVVNDGEFGKASFITYIKDRLGGFTPSKEPAGLPWAKSREARDFPEFYTPASRPQGSGAAAGFIYMICDGPVSYKGGAALRRDIDNLKAALKPVTAEEGFYASLSPSMVAWWQRDAHYKSYEEFLYAIADAMHEEYKMIVDAGLVLQIDDPIFATYYVLHPELGIEQCRKWCAAQVEALNHALRGIPEDRIRYHTCYSINMGPRIHDMELKHIVDILLTIRAQAYSFEFANPRHEHEWRVWQDIKLRDDKFLIPGFITHSNILVEHPELIAEQIGRFAKVVGRERVMAGADCGFGSFATTTPEVHNSIVKHKLKSLVEGARLASRQLWAAKPRRARKPAPLQRKRAAGGTSKAKRRA